ncbi:uncharacterized protein DUF4245 [Micromonospora kangleipakensis]|uniref:Uncharacterized protein DUF4245 n=1 Tax=Micromonospora kangleipakensis TaxID=1077942 RepID=A0A4Q8B6M7_9ACTN|nr:DUF4245 domain-containing protein [Micromonospora kangleipakensis]RZU73284.1 uncharacterized protein DUF4245 [Micromonospora kangleipakensis]
MEAAQPADRVPTDTTPPDGQPPVRATAGPSPEAGEPALVEPATGPAPLPDAGEPALVEPVDGTARGEVGAHPAVSGDQPAPPARRDKARSERSPRDMALSLLVLLVPIALLLAFYRGFLGGDEPATVDPAPAVQEARAANAFPVSAPAGLASDWRTVSARYQPEPGGATLRIGYLTPEGRGAQLVQSNVPAEKLLPAELSGGQPQGTADLPGGSWQRYTARGNEQALVLLEPTRTVIVVGDAGEAELRQLASALR